MPPAEIPDQDKAEQDGAEPVGLPIEGLDFGDIPAESPPREESKDKEGAKPGEEEDPFAKISELMMSSMPEPIPDVFATAPARPVSRRKGAAGLWLLLLVVLVAGLGVAGYFLQDAVIEMVPAAARYYEQLGIRNGAVGAGLAFRNCSSERVDQGGTEVLIVRGVIANTTEQARDVPLLRLALYNDQVFLQEKIFSPPQAGLDGHGTVGFRITMDQPDANATRFEVTFTAAKPPASTPAPAGQGK